MGRPKGSRNKKTTSNHSAGGARRGPKFEEEQRRKKEARKTAWQNKIDDNKQNGAGPKIFIPHPENEELMVTALGGCCAHQILRPILWESSGSLAGPFGPVESRIAMIFTCCKMIVVHLAITTATIMLYVMLKPMNVNVKKISWETIVKSILLVFRRSSFLVVRN